MKTSEVNTPLGMHFSILTKYYIGIVSHELSMLDIERYYYPVLLIEQAESPICQTQLAEELGTDKVRMVRIADYLVMYGYIKRSRSRRDRRYYNLEVTTKARKVLPQIKLAFETANKVCFAGFDDREIKLFQKLLFRMQQNLELNPRIEVKLNYKKIK